MTQPNFAFQCRAHIFLKSVVEVSILRFVYFKRAAESALVLSQINYFAIGGYLKDELRVLFQQKLN